MEKFTTDQLKMALIEMQKMASTEEIVLAHSIAYEELERRLTPEGMDVWWDEVMA